MEIIRYRVPPSAYPRYEYSLRHHTSYMDRVQSLFKKLDARTQVESLNFNLAEIDVLRLSASAPIVDEMAIQQRPSEKVESNTEVINNIETYLSETPLDEYDTRLLVISLDDLPGEIDLFKNHLKNVLFICQSSEKAQSLKLRIMEDDGIVTTKAELGREIAFSLERVVFRNIGKVVPVIRAMSEDVLMPSQLFDQLNDEAVKALKACAYTPFLKGLETEIDPQSKDYGTILREMCYKRYIQLHPDIATPGRVQDGEINKVPVGNCIGYQIIKIAERVTNTTAQTICSVYKAIPAAIRDILPDTARPDPVQIQGSLYDQIVLALYTHVVPDVSSKTVLETTHEAQSNIAEEKAEQKDGPSTTQFETTDHLLRSLRSNKKDVIRELQKEIVRLPVVQSIDKHMAMIRESRDEVADLVGEVRGMYSRSKVPQYERPISPVVPKKKLSEKVAKALFENVDRIKGCGYRYNKLTIFLDKEPAEQELDEMTIKGKIKNILSQYGISEYDITPATKSVKHYRQVGAKIKASKCGTLGGFAVMKQTSPLEDALCALVSMHVVNGARELMLVQNGDTDVQIGSMIRAREHSKGEGEDEGEGEGEGEGLIDVAAAKILEDKVNMCDTSFKDSVGNNLPSRLHNKTDDTDFLTGRYVHIYGATTPLGKGIITMPSYFDRNEQDIIELITIEDIGGGEDGILRFSREGDSGAVICADDPDGECVHVISMLIGCLNYQDIGDDPANKGKYLTFSMTNALNKLKRKTGNPFELCR